MSIINSCVVAHQFAISSSSCNYKPLQHHGSCYIWDALWGRGGGGHRGAFTSTPHAVFSCPWEIVKLFGHYLHPDRLVRASSLSLLGLLSSPFSSLRLSPLHVTPNYPPLLCSPSPSPPCFPAPVTSPPITCPPSPSLSPSPPPAPPPSPSPLRLTALQKNSSQLAT